jgi:hypothetical protein
MSYKPGNKYFFDSRSESIQCIPSGRLVDNGYITAGGFVGQSYSYEFRWSDGYQGSTRTLGPNAQLFWSDIGLCSCTPSSAGTLINIATNAPQYPTTPVPTLPSLNDSTLYSIAEAEAKIMVYVNEFIRIWTEIYPYLEFYQQNQNYTFSNDGGTVRLKWSSRSPFAIYVDITLRWWNISTFTKPACCNRSAKELADGGIIGTYTNVLGTNSTLRFSGIKILAGNNNVSSNPSFFIKYPSSGQVLTLKSGVNTWVNPYYDICTTRSTMPSLSYILKSGTNLYTQYFGIEPYSISATNLPPGLGLKSYNTITGIPTQTGSYKCNLIYTYCPSTQYTAITRPITINIYAGPEETIPYNKIFNSTLGPQLPAPSGYSLDIASTYTYTNANNTISTSGTRNQISIIDNTRSNYNELSLLNLESGTSNCGYGLSLVTIVDKQKLFLERNSIITGSGSYFVITGYSSGGVGEPPLNTPYSGEFFTPLTATTSEAWVYPTAIEEYTVNVGKYIYSLAPGTNLYTKKYENGLFPNTISSSYLKYLDDFEGEDLDPNVPEQQGLPVGLAFKDWRTITGIPSGLGRWKCSIRLGYCNSPNQILGTTKNFDLVIVPSEYIKYVSGPVYMAVPPNNLISYNLVKTKSLNFDYVDSNQFTKYVDNITGYGDMNIIGNFSDTPYYGYISGLTGYLPAVTYVPVTLEGVIPEDSSTYVWNDVLVSSEGSRGNVYIDRIIGYTQAQNSITINTNLLANGDFLSINDINFYYRTDPQDLKETYYYFNSLNGLIGVLNSGALGTLEDINLQSVVGVTGYVSGSTLNLFSYGLIGEAGNYTKISKTVENPASIEIPNRYFSGGRSIRQLSNTWYGSFETNYPIIIGERSGLYIYEYTNENFVQNISGVIWDDTFSGNYYITTGIYKTNDLTSLSGNLMPFIPSLGIYSGDAIIPSGQTRTPSGFSISILKPNFYNIQGNIAKYTLKGNDFIYTGTIEG